MDLQQRTLRVGLTAILCAAVFRLCSTDTASLSRLSDIFPIDARKEHFETGQDVRFSPSLEVFSPDFVETPPPLIPEAKKQPLPYFSAADLVQVQYAANVRPDLNALISQPLQWDLYGEEPTVLIIHTHGTESYTRKGKPYKESAAYRTLDENYNMLFIGQQVADLLNSQGIPTIQDRQLHDYPSYNGSYSHARKAIQEYLPLHLLRSLQQAHHTPASWPPLWLLSCLGCLPRPLCMACREVSVPSRQMRKRIHLHLPHLF